MDDGAFTRRNRYAPLVVIVWSSPDQVESIEVGRVSVDGTDATRSVGELLRRSPPFEGVRAVLLDGVAFGGFNVVDLDRLHARTRRPVIALTRRAPDFPRIRSALRTYFPKDHAVRWRRLRRHALFEVPTAGEPILAAAVGCSRSEALAVIARSTVRGFWPEPLRLAHLVARGIGRAARSRAPSRR